MTYGVLMLFTGEKVLGPKGTWLRYFMEWKNPATLSPTYGTLDDVHKWLRDDFKIAPEHIETFDRQFKASAKPEQFYFDVSMEESSID